MRYIAGRKSSQLLLSPTPSEEWFFQYYAVCQSDQPIGHLLGVRFAIINRDAGYVVRLLPAEADFGKEEMSFSEKLKEEGFTVLWLHVGDMAGMRQVNDLAAWYRGDSY